MALSAGSYRGRVGDRAFFTGLGSAGFSPFAGSGPYGPGQRAGVGMLPQHQRVRMGATMMSHLRPAFQQTYPNGLQLAGITLRDAPIPHQRVTLPNGHKVVVY